MVYGGRIERELLSYMDFGAGARMHGPWQRFW